MTGPTQRAGPWESNLGLEPEWDGASGLWNFAGEDSWSYSGTIHHREGICEVRLTTKNEDNKHLIKLLNFYSSTKRALLQGYVRKPNEEKNILLTTYGQIIPSGFKIDKNAVSRFASFKLYPDWVLVGRHLSSIEEAKWQKMLIWVDLLPGVLPRKFVVEKVGNLDKIDIADTNRETVISRGLVCENHKCVEINLLSDYEGLIEDSAYYGGSANLTLKDKVKVVVSEPLAVNTPVNKDSKDEINSLSDIIDRLVGLIEVIAEQPASVIQWEVLDNSDHSYRLYFPFLLASKKSEVKNSVNIIKDNVLESGWSSLLSTWFSMRSENHYWRTAIDYIHLTLRAMTYGLYIDDYFSNAAKILETSFRLPENFTCKDNIRSRICYQLKESEIIKRIPPDLIKDIAFDEDSVANVSTILRHEYAHAGSKDSTGRIRKYLRSGGYTIVHSLAWFLFTAALMLIKKQELEEYLISHPVNSYTIQYQFHQRVFPLVSEWNDLYKVCTGNDAIKKKS